MSNFKFFVLHVGKQTFLFGVLSLILLCLFCVRVRSELTNGSQTHLFVLQRLLVTVGKGQCEKEN